MRLSTISFFLFFTLIACNNEIHPFEKEISEVDENLVYVDSLNDVFYAVDTLAIQSEFPLVDSIHQIMTGPSAPEDKAYWTNTIRALQIVHRPYSKFLRDAPKIRKNLAYSKSQLQALRNSLLDQKLDSTKAAEYIQTEATALRELALLLNKRIPPVKVAIGVWDTAQARYLDILAKNDSLGQ
ncbi:MAG: hypothetical protein NXI09_03475 [Bacteroidetes bacterium]|nr:hypothetical protein [Bacteroidota bacterium]